MWQHYFKITSTLTYLSGLVVVFAEFDLSPPCLVLLQGSLTIWENMQSCISFQAKSMGLLNITNTSHHILLSNVHAMMYSRHMYM